MKYLIIAGSILVIGYIAFITYIILSKQQISSSRNASEAQRQPRDSTPPIEGAAVISDVVEGGNAAEQAREQKEDAREEAKATRENRGIVVNGILAFLTFCIVLISYKQMRDNKQASIDGQRNTDNALALTRRNVAVAEKNAATAESSLGLTEQSNKITSENLELQRSVLMAAYEAKVIVRGIKVKNFELGKEFSFEFEIVNLGTLPATKVGARTQASIYAKEQDVVWDEFDKIPIKGYTPLAVGEFNPAEATSGFEALGQPRFDNLKSGVWKLFFCIELIYEDKLHKGLTTRSFGYYDFSRNVMVKCRTNNY